MTDQITVPKQTWDAMREALSSLCKLALGGESILWTAEYDAACRAIMQANAVSEQLQAQGEPLTDEQIKRIYMCETGWSISDNDTSLIDFARAILAAAHGITKGITT